MMKVRTQGLVVKMVVILVEEEKMREMLVVVVGVVDRSPFPALLTPLPGPPQGAGAHSCCVLGGCVARPPFGEGWGGASLPWVAAPTLFATL